MAVAAADLALGDLGLECREADVPEHGADLTAFGAHVVELEHEHVLLAAVCTPAGGEYAVDEPEIATHRRRERATPVLFRFSESRPTEWAGQYCEFELPLAAGENHAALCQWAVLSGELHIRARARGQ